MPSIFYLDFLFCICIALHTIRVKAASSRSLKRSAGELQPRTILLCHESDASSVRTRLKLKPMTGSSPNFISINEFAITLAMIKGLENK